MIPLAKNIKRYFSLKEVAIVLLAVVISVSAGIGVFFSLKTDVAISVDGKEFDVKTMKTTVGEVLEQNGINVYEDDNVSNKENKKLSFDSKLQKIGKNEIHIKRAIPIYVYVDGQEKKLMTYLDTVKEAFADNVKLSALDRLEGANLEDKIVKDMKIKVVRVKEDEVKEDIPIAFNETKRENSRLDKGVVRTAREGKEGIREKLYKIVLEDGIEVARALKSDKVLSTPIDKILEFGTILNHKTSRGETLRYQKVLNMRATAYTASFADTGKHPDDPGFGITYTGAKVRKGMIAVDPKVIPLGSRVFVEVAGDTPDYGYAVAADIGGAIKGDLIDLYFDDAKAVDRWGCKRVKLYVLID